jgi:hypothetical protein
METDEHDIRGVWTRGSEPKELVLSDGSRLSLGADDAAGGGVNWERSDGRDETSGTVSVPKALELAGEHYSPYVQVRTRAEAEWLRSVADWCSAEASRLDQDLATALR